MRLLLALLVSVACAGCISDAHAQMDMRTVMMAQKDACLQYTVEEWGSPNSLIPDGNGGEIATWDRIWLRAPDGHRILVRVSLSSEPNGNFYHWNAAYYAGSAY